MRYRPLAALLVLAGVLTPATIFGAASFQQPRVVGLVIDPARHPIDAVEVILNRHEVRAVTGTTGFFALDVSPADSTIAFRRIGYVPSVFAIRPLPRSDDTLLVVLEPSAIQLTEVTVSAEPTKPLRYAFTTKYDEVFHRRKIGLGTLVSRETIDGRLGARTEQLLDGMAGVRVWNGPPKRIRFVRCQEPGGIAVFINGVRQNPSSSPRRASDQSGLLYKPPSSGSSPSPVQDDEPEIDILLRVNPSDIEMIEVFRGPSEIPAEFHWNGCAVIAIWLREK